MHAKRQDYRMRRLRRHLILALGSGTLTLGIFSVLHSPGVIWRVSMASAYVGGGLLIASLVIGPWYALRGRPNPVSTDVRRDIGIWAGVLGLIHVVAGLLVHMEGRMHLYFLFPPHAATFTRIRYDLFGVANYVGACATVILLMLLALSNDVSLRLLGPRRWKFLQRGNYALIVLIFVHALAYQWLEKRLMPWGLGILAAIAVLGIIRVLGCRASVRR